MLAITLTILQYPIEKIAGNNNQQRYHAEENSNQSPSHHLLEHGGFGDGEADDGHHKGNGRTERNTLGYKYLDNAGIWFNI